MPPLIAFLLLQQPAAIVEPPAPPAAAAERCLPGNAGFLSMRLRGSIEADVEWREPELDCTGMPRPDGHGLRLRFSGPLPGAGELAIVFAAPDLGMGVLARGVPVNVTLLDEVGERIYGTQGDSRCVFDEVEQLALVDPLLPPRSYRVSARGFCTVPALAMDGDGTVLLTRFDFTGLVTYQEEDAAAPGTALLFPDLPRAEIQVITAGDRHDFKVWIADTEHSRERGLMFVKSLPADHGMLFLFEEPQFASFWMKNTYLSLDIVFIGSDGVVVNVAHDAPTLSERPIESDAPVLGVLELVAGTAAHIGLKAGDRIVYPAFAIPQPQ
jgi:uncharacterized membrane protein (UPF0127 family)